MKKTLLLALLTPFFLFSCKDSPTAIESQPTTRQVTYNASVSGHTSSATLYWSIGTEYTTVELTGDNLTYTVTRSVRIGETVGLSLNASASHHDSTLSAVVSISSPSGTIASQSLSGFGVHPIINGVVQ
jgi:hypothetical protein